MTPPSPWHDRTLRVLCFLFAATLCLAVLLAAAAAMVSFEGAAPAPSGGSPVSMKILAVNDFHGQVPEGQLVNNRPVGSAPVLAAYLREAVSVFGPENTVIALPGDVVGASPPESGLLHDEPSYLFFNALAGTCTAGRPGQQDPGCLAVATLGNHEFDRPLTELLRQTSGGNGATQFVHPGDPYPGFLPGYVCSNVVFQDNGTPLFPPYTVKTIGGIPVAFIGADTALTPTLIAPQNAQGLLFLNETESVNRYVADLNRAGVHAIVLLLHEGGDQPAYAGPTRVGGNVTGRIKGIVAGLDGDVDVVLSAHTHRFTNAWLPNRAGRPVLVTQAYSYSKGYADINLTLDPVSRDIIGKSAQIVIPYADVPPGTRPDPGAAALLARSRAIVAPQVKKQVAVAATDITGNQNACGESALGDLLADAQRSAMKSDIAFITSGTLRENLDRGDVSWGELFAIQPFSATLVSVNLTGRQVRAALERQWEEPLPPHNLGVSGLTYRYERGKPAGSRVQDVMVGDRPLDPEARYSVAMMDYLSYGGDQYTVLAEGTGLARGPSDVETLVMYLGSLPQPVTAPAGGRISCTP